MFARQIKLKMETTNKGKRGRPRKIATEIKSTESKVGQEVQPEVRASNEELNVSKENILQIITYRNGIETNLTENRTLQLIYRDDNDTFTICLRKKMENELEALSFNPFKLNAVKEENGEVWSVAKMAISVDALNALVISYSKIIENNIMNPEVEETEQKQTSENEEK